MGDEILGNFCPRVQGVKRVSRVQSLAPIKLHLILAQPWPKFLVPHFPHVPRRSELGQIPQPVPGSSPSPHFPLLMTLPALNFPIHPPSPRREYFIFTELS